MKHVPLRENAEKTSYYKFLKEMVPLTDEIREMVAQADGKMEDALEPEDRALLQTEGYYPKEAGVYPLKKGGLLVASTVPIPHITGDMVAWWFPWHSLDGFRYALWDPEDHYNVTVNEVGRQRALDPDVPVYEKMWGATHDILESFDCEPPGQVILAFQNPGECGYDWSKIKTKYSEFLICMNGKIGDGVPVFVTENFTTANGEMEAHLRFWIGYECVDGEVVCRLPEGAEVPVEIAKMLMLHNYKEFRNFDAVIPALYEAEKDNWEVTV